MSTVLKELQGTLCLIGDSLVWARSRRACQETEAMLEKIQSTGVVLNPEKCEFSKDQLITCYIAIYI